MRNRGQRAVGGVLSVVLTLAALLVLSSPGAAAPTRAHTAAAAARHAATKSANAGCAAGASAVTGGKITVDANGLAKGNFTIAAGCEGLSVSLVSYTAPAATFSLPQTEYLASTLPFNPGDQSLEVQVPSCFYQVDLVVGDVLPVLDSGHLYGSQKVAPSVNGGSQSCPGTTPPPAQCPGADAAITDASLVVAGDIATGTFTVASGCTDVQVSLASYSAPGATFALPQTLFDAASVTKSAGTWTLTATVPPCFYQVDLVRGPYIQTLTPTQLYGGNKLAFSNGGTGCTTTTAPPANTPPPPGNNAPVGGQAPVQTLPAPTADVAIAKTAETTSLAVGDTATYTIGVTNDGEAPAADVVVSEDLPAGLTFVSAVPSTGTCTTAIPIVCSLGTLAAGASASIQLQARVVSAGTIVNTATVSTTTTESNIANNTAHATITATAPPGTFTPPAAVCASLTAPTVKLQSSHRSVFTVRVATKEGKPVANAVIRAKGPGVTVVRRTSSAGVAHFALRPRGAGVIELTLVQSSSCAPQQAAFQVLAAHTTLQSPQFTG